MILGGSSTGSRELPRPINCQKRNASTTHPMRETNLTPRPRRRIRIANIPSLANVGILHTLFSCHLPPRNFGISTRLPPLPSAHQLTRFPAHQPPNSSLLLNISKRSSSDLQDQSHPRHRVEDLAFQASALQLLKLRFKTRFTDYGICDD